MFHTLILYLVILCPHRICFLHLSLYLQLYEYLYDHDNYKTSWLFSCTDSKIMSLISKQSFLNSEFLWVNSFKIIKFDCCSK